MSHFLKVWVLLSIIIDVNTVGFIMCKVLKKNVLLSILEKHCTSRFLLWQTSSEMAETLKDGWAKTSTFSTILLKTGRAL